MLSKLYDMGILNTSAKLSDVENKLTVAAFCRRRLAVIMCMSKMAETVSAVSPAPSRPLAPFSWCCGLLNSRPLLLSVLAWRVSIRPSSSSNRGTSALDPTR